jgi:DNA-binding MarR family transcriptional regulator
LKDFVGFESEINTIEIIKENPKIYISKIAEKFCVTKGAVSQIIQKLEKKGFLKKIKDDINHSKLKLKLTNKGKIAYKEYEKHHEEFDKVIKKLLGKASEKEILFLEKFIKNFTKEINSHKKN